MKIFITSEQKIELERLHDSSRDKHVCDRIKAVLLASEGWSSVMIAQALRLYQTTVDHHISEYLNKGKLKPENGDSDGMLNTEENEQLINHLAQHLFHHTAQIVASVAQTWSVIYSIPGMNEWQHRHGFSYKKPSSAPHKFSEEKQQQFIEYYEELKVATRGEPILFLDAVHPTQATKLSFGWIRKGEEKTVETTESRTRMNILGALDLNDAAHPVIHDYETINEHTICQFFNEIRTCYSDYNQPIHIILDGAGYNKTNLVKDWAFVCNIKLHHLPPYSPNLNPIERLWKLMHECARNKRYFASKPDFRTAIFNFFTTTLPEMAGSLSSRLNVNFQVLKQASSS